MTTFARRNSLVIEVEPQNEPLINNQGRVSTRDKSDGTQILADRRMHWPARPSAQRFQIHSCAPREAWFAVAVTIFR